MEESEAKSEEYYQLMDTRRTVKYFSPDHISFTIIQNIIKAAGTAPSGAHTEPWTYVVVCDPEVKMQIRKIIELDEKQCYAQRTGQRVNKIGKNTDSIWKKDYLTTAPYLILVFKQLYSFQDDSKKKMNFYNEMSVAIAAGILLTAIHYAGLVSLTSTPLNSENEIRKILNRPKNERLVLLVPVGYPAENATVPDLSRKHLSDIMVEI
ncbi:hypothetical protein AAG570_001438 [Ranatra chinensis]|uniref:Nitroreductase domain-containing protein n=1 Tax=Ranatra chinensis TaxID=642074 RepID=A0ABD0YC36_9HEMI